VTGTRMSRWARSMIRVAAFGPSAVRVAAQYSDRMVISLVTAATAERLAGQLHADARAAGRPVPRLAAWIPVVVDGVDAARRQVRRTLIGSVAVLGDEDTVRGRPAAYGPHVDQLGVLPCSTDHDPAGARTLRVLARLTTICEEKS
jgi:alkanesulfonate monooxygenase SsuD/methylene tetrahydromethanopterin reductase-like flavin-dependent oxidoreductase (luciferase family)